MSRSFNGSSQYGHNSFTMGTTPLTLCAWVYPESVTGSGKAVMGFFGNQNVYQMFGLSTALGKWYCASRAAGTEYYAASTTSPANTTWTHVCAVFASTASRIIYVNGANEGSNSSNVTVSPSRFSVAVRTDGAVPAASPNYFTGQMAEVCAFDAGLSASQVAELAAGLSPLQVSPGNLRVYLPLFGEQSPEINWRGTGLTLVGSPPVGSTAPRTFRSQ